MAKMFIQSNDADVKEHAVFETPPTNTSVTERRFLNFHPVLGITPTTNVIHFSVKGFSLKYVDLQHSRLYIRCKIRDMDGGVPDQDIFFPINHLLQSMWKQVEVFLGGKLVSSGKNEGIKKRLCSELFYEDTQGAHDSLNDSPMNEGSYYRKKLTQNGQTFELEGMLNEDALHLDKYMINAVDVDWKLYPSRSSFVLMSDNPQKEYRIVIEEAIFKCCTMDVGNRIISAHSKTLQEGGMAQYFFNQPQINNFTIAQGQRNFSETVFQGKIPHKIVIAFVSSQRYNGNYSLNPFEFNHYNANTMSILVNDVCMPHRPLEMNFQKGQFTSALCNVLREHPNVIIDAKSFDNGYSLFVFNVNLSHDEDDLALQNSGNVQLKVQFAEELPESMQVLVYGEFQSCIQVDNARTIMYTPL